MNTRHPAGDLPPRPKPRTERRARADFVEGIILSATVYQPGRGPVCKLSDAEVRAIAGFGDDYAAALIERYARGRRWPSLRARRRSA